MRKIRDLLIKIVRFIFHKIKKLVVVKDKITYEMYKQQKDKNQKVAKKIKDVNSKMETNKSKLYEAYEEINLLKSRNTKLEEQNKKLENNNRTLKKRLDEEIDKNKELEKEIFKYMEGRNDIS